MATTYPTALTTYTNPTATDQVSVAVGGRTHSQFHADNNDDIEALQAKVGIDGSAVTTSHDYKLSSVTSTAKAVSTAGNQTIGGVKTFSDAGGVVATGAVLTTPQIAGSTGTGVHDFGASDSFEIPNSATPTVNANGEIAVDTTVADFSHGIVKYYGGEEMAVIAVPVGELASPTEGDVITYNATADEFQLVQPTQQAEKPSFVDFNAIDATASVCRNLYTDEEAYVCSGSTTTNIRVVRSGSKWQVRNTTTEFANADECNEVVVLDGYLYALLVDTGTDPDTYQLWRYSMADLSSSPTQMTFSGSNQLANNNSGLRMTCDGTNFYFNYLAGNSANAYTIGKYTLSGTTLTYSSTITLSDSATLKSFSVFSDGTIAIIDAGTGEIKTYNSSGTLQATGQAVATNYQTGMWNYGDTIYLMNNTTNFAQKTFVK